MSFRSNTPSRRAVIVKCADYHKYKKALQEDFNCRCGYCDDYDRYAGVPFQIDHFVPRAVMSVIKDNDYSNLVYACQRCNRAKWDKWPSKDENVSVVNNTGFIDPCDKAFDSQFSRNERGEILPLTPLGTWMWTELNLGNAAHRLIWARTQIREAIHKMMTIPDLKDKPEFNSLCTKFFEFENELLGEPIF